MTPVDEKEPLKGLSVPRDIDEKVKRARDAMRKDQDKRRVMVKFWQGEQYWYVKQRGGLGLLSTALDAVDKQNFRVRNTYNFLHSVVEGKVSAATQRIPGYEVAPSTSDPEDIAGARIAQQMAFYGFDKWRLDRYRTKAVTNALVQREGFLRPYFDPNVGPYRLNEQGEWVGAGEVRVLSLSRSEVGWEPGVDFEESPFWIIERAVLKEQIKQIPGFVGGDLPSDAKTSDLPDGKKSDQMTVLTEYLERPCSKYPLGRRCFIADKQIVVDARKVDPLTRDWWETYPNEDANGQVSDEPVIHRLSYTVDPEGDDRGLLEHLVDLQRTILDCWNKLLEIKNRALMLQMIAPKGSNVPRRDDTPGATYEYSPTAAGKPEWEKAPDPGYINQLLQILREAKADLRSLAADFDVPQDLTDVAAKSMNAAVEQQRIRWQSFLADFARFDSRLMRHCLTLVARNYDRERIIQVRGTHGWEPAETFIGQDMRSQVNVTVLPGSIETRTRQSVLQEIQFITQTWGPDALRPEVAMSALHGGTAEGLFKSYDLHKARAWALVQKLRSNHLEVMNMPPRMDVELGDPALGFMVPGWMPRKQDNLVIWKQVFADYMISPDFEEKPADCQHMFDLIWDGLEKLEQRRMLMLAAETQDVAKQLGAQNAARPQDTIPAPQMNGLSREQAEPAAATPGG